MEYVEKEGIAMISIEDIYYLFTITSTLCAASFALGYKLGKNARKKPSHTLRKLGQLFQ